MIIGWKPMPLTASGARDRERLRRLGFSIARQSGRSTYSAVRFNDSRVQPPNESIAVMIGFEWALDRHSNVIGLFRTELGQFHSDLFQMQPGHFFVELFR